MLLYNLFILLAPGLSVVPRYPHTNNDVRVRIPLRLIYLIMLLIIYTLSLLKDYYNYTVLLSFVSFSLSHPPSLCLSVSPLSLHFCFVYIFLTISYLFIFCLIGILQSPLPYIRHPPIPYGKFRH